MLPYNGQNLIFHKLNDRNFISQINIHFSKNLYEFFAGNSESLIKNLSRFAPTSKEFIVKGMNLKGKTISSLMSEGKRANFFNSFT
jgi:hypothetical protein